jgi:hypothetical protein
LADFHDVRLKIVHVTWRVSGEKASFACFAVVAGIDAVA